MTPEQALDLDWLKANAKQIHFFGLGFIQVKIDDKWRVHFYTKKWNATTKPEDIHNHRYSFRSLILRGTLKQETFTVEEHDAGDCEVTKETCNPRNKKEFPKKGCFVSPSQVHTMVAPSFYVTQSEVFHRVASDDAITLIERYPYEYDEADVVYLRGEAPTCPFSVKVSEEELWAEVKRMLS